MEELISYLRELRIDNAATGERLQIEQARDEKEKADIAAAMRTLTSWWEKHKPSEPLPEAVTGETAKPIHAHVVNPDPVEGMKQVFAAAFNFVQERFTTKEFFPLIPAIVSGEVPESQGYDFLRKQVEDGRLWVYEKGAGRRPTTYSKQPVPAVLTRMNTSLATIMENISPGTDMPTHTVNVLGGNG